MYSITLTDHEIAWLVALIRNNLTQKSRMGIYDARGNQLANKLMFVVNSLKPGERALLQVGESKMQEKKEKLPPSFENLDPAGREIVDSKLTEEEIEEAIQQLKKVRRLSVWRLLRRW